MKLLKIYKTSSCGYSNALEEEKFILLIPAVIAAAIILITTLAILVGAYDGSYNFQGIIVSLLISGLLLTPIYVNGLIVERSDI